MIPLTVATMEMALMTAGGPLVTREKTRLKGAADAASSACGTDTSATQTTATYNRVDRTSVMKMASGSMRSGSSTSSARLASPSKPMKAKKASNMDARMPLQAVMPDKPCQASGNRVTRSGDFTAPATMITSNPPISISVMRPASTRDCRMPQMTTRPVTSTTTGTMMAPGTCGNSART